MQVKIYCGSLIYCEQSFLYFNFVILEFWTIFSKLKKRLGQMFGLVMCPPVIFVCGLNSKVSYFFLGPFLSWVDVKKDVKGATRLVILCACLGQAQELLSKEGYV
jgi:hypothetical protein